MISILFPKKYIQSIFQVGKPSFIHALKKRNITLLLFDIDNTLAPYYEKRASQKVIDLILHLKGNGFDVGFLSNGKKERVNEFNRDLNLPAYYKSGKPWIRGIKKAMTQLKKKNGETAVIGDQVFTDVLCANLAGAYSILVKQMSEKDEWITGIKRGAERKVMSVYGKKLEEKRSKK